jgi:hypothetical protein
VPGGDEEFRVAAKYLFENSKYHQTIKISDIIISNSDRLEIYACDSFVLSC